jgi:alanyl-tRNA synthetase
MKKYFLVMAFALMLFSCDTKEKATLQRKVDSLSVQLSTSREVERKMNELGVLIDSIDASRESLKVKMIEGGSYADYVVRLKDINLYVQQTQVKLDALEKETKNTSRASNAAVRRLKADLEKQTKEILNLQAELAKARDENLAVWKKVNEKDSVLSMKDQMIKVKESDITSLEKLVSDTDSENKTAVANLYYAQAEALELAANRTHFAPRKKKDTRREALELYKLSLSLGNTGAQVKIDNLNKQLS